MSFTPLSFEQARSEWPEQLDHFSASGAKMALRCPEQWRQRYLLGLIEPPNGALLWGRADHKAIEQNFEHKLTTYEDLPVAEVAEHFAVEFDREVSESGGVGEIEWRQTPYTDRRKAAGWTKDKGVQLATMYREEAAPFFQPVSIEEEFELELPGVPVKVVGRIDLTVTDTSLFGPTPEDEPLIPRMIERKTSSVSPRAINADWRLQSGIYQIVKPLVHEWHFSVKPREHGRKQAAKIVWGDHEFVQAPHEADRKRTIRLLEMIVARIGHYMTLYGPDEPWPGDGKYTPMWNGSACSYCGFQPHCFWWKP